MALCAPAVVAMAKQCCGISTMVNICTPSKVVTLSTHCASHPTDIGSVPPLARPSRSGIWKRKPSPMKSSQRSNAPRWHGLLMAKHCSLVTPIIKSESSKSTNVNLTCKATATEEYPSPVFVTLGRKVFCFANRLFLLFLLLALLS